VLTYGQLKSGVCKRIASACPNGQTFTDLAQAGVRQLMQRGDWWSIVQPMRFCTQGNSIVYPRFVAAILAFNRCGQPTPVANQWFEFEPFDSWHQQAAGCCRRGENWPGGFTAVTDGTTSILNQIPAGNLNKVRFYVSAAVDYGKTVTVFGTDQHGQVVYSTHPDGSYQEGLVLTLAQPYVESSIYFSKIFRIVKAVTANVIRGFLYDPNTALMNILGEYQPTETAPEYIHSKLMGSGGGRAQVKCCATMQVSALVKLQFIPFVNDNDIVPIDNEDAIRDMIISIRQKEAGNIAEAKAMEESALRELNYQLKTRYPNEQFVSNFRPFGTASLSRVTGGFL
jgi:hypothetical protein